MDGPTYTLREIARELQLPESTIRYYRDAFALYLPSVGLGRRRRYPTEALDIFRLIVDGYSQSLSREEIELQVQQVAPPVTVTPATTRLSALRVRQPASLERSTSEELVATLMDGERERRDVMWQLTKEIVRMGEALDRQGVLLGQITQRLEFDATRALPPASAPAAPGTPAAPPAEQASLAHELHALREELQRERELVERLRRSKLDIERRAAAAEAELQQRNQRG